jgi:carbonic anhydrase
MISASAMPVHDEILHRLQRFRTQYFPRFEQEFKGLVEKGQRPRALFIGWSDSRVLSHLLTGAGHGADRVPNR